LDSLHFNERQPIWAKSTASRSVSIEFKLYVTTLIIGKAEKKKRAAWRDEMK
jgi:hypothetical protein